MAYIDTTSGIGLSTRILLIDDSPEDRYVFRRLLLRGGDNRYVVTESGNVDEGLAVARQDPPDCVVVDFALPDRNGLEALLTLRDELDLPVVMMTGTGSEEIAVEAMKRGAHDYLVKTTTTAAGLRIAIQNAVEKHSLQRQLAEQQKRESRIAETLQRSLLFKPAAGAFPNLDFDMIYQPALDEAKIGGDFYDVFALDETRVVLVVGDVSGKGLMAATWTAKVRYGLRAFLSEYSEPSLAMSRLNDFLCLDQGGEGMDDDSPLTVRSKFVVLALAVIDTRDGQSQFVSAGAEPPVLLTTSAEGEVGCYQIDGEPSSPLGIELQQRYDTSDRELAVGDLIVMATDGITEARKPGSRRFFGIEGVEAVLRRTALDPDATLDSIGGAILDAARVFAGGALRDDACLLLARRK